VGRRLAAWRQRAHRASGIASITDGVELRGVHGARPDDQRLDAAFVVAGPGIPRGHNIGRIDQRDVAPTVAILPRGAAASKISSALRTI